jgi:hypothetical protein
MCWIPAPSLTPPPPLLRHDNIGHDSIGKESSHHEIDTYRPGHHESAIQGSEHDKACAVSKYSEEKTRSDHMYMVDYLYLYPSMHMPLLACAASYCAGLYCYPDRPPAPVAAAAAAAAAFCLSEL